ncbi:MAG TPA: hypothetical protein VK721_14125 [Solirubrobacteraceae bacterium]|jgi:hypothetical protein|nr:hypothetical protein [Solirubrobacteraceae bacterium]
MRPARQTSQRRPRQTARPAVGLPAALLAGLAVLVLASCSTSKERAETAPSSCNGAAGLCERRLNEVVFAGTHNSMAASDEPGWSFANQRYGISRQLDDGIRALLIDVHFGVYDAATGRVRTDLSAEGSDRNKVAKQVPPLALRLADRVAGRVGVGTLSGKPALYLCHTLCELGAEPLERELEVIRDFLDRHPHQVLIVIVEDYVPPASIERSFEQAGLMHYVATLERGQPPPTLGALIARGQRLMVFAEEKGGTPAWYMPAFSFIQDTPLGATRPDQLSCKRYRGEQHSPLLLINHWIPPFPPSPSLNAAIGREAFLRTRIKRCLAQDGAKGAIVAVDFYQRTSVVKVARELDGEGG